MHQLAKDLGQNIRERRISVGRNRSINPVLADGFFQEAEAEAGELFHGSSAS